MVSSGTVAIGAALGFEFMDSGAWFADSRQPLNLVQPSTTRWVQMPGENEPQPSPLPAGRRR